MGHNRVFGLGRALMGCLSLANTCPVEIFIIKLTDTDLYQPQSFLCDPLSACRHALNSLAYRLPLPGRPYRRISSCEHGIPTKK
jgi:hypothetical protein